VMHDLIGHCINNTVIIDKMTAVIKFTITAGLVFGPIRLRSRDLAVSGISFDSASVGNCLLVKTNLLVLDDQIWTAHREKAKYCTQAIILLAMSI